jgi:hypothetical protein
MSQKGDNYARRDTDGHGRTHHYPAHAQCTVHLDRPVSARPTGDVEHRDWSFYDESFTPGGPGEGGSDE